MTFRAPTAAGEWLRLGLGGLLLVGIATAASAGLLRPFAAPTASECDSIDSIPARFDIDYQSDVQPIFDQHCANCHVDSGGAPEAGLELDSGVSWYELVDVASSQDPSLTRVKSFDPANSLLFHKVNCENPDLGSRMPYERIPITLAEQALIHDWIATGASMTTSETIFFAGFEDRP
jgi:hypothetical protein